MQTSSQEASFGHRGQPMVQVTPILVPTEKQLLALGAVATRFRVPRDTRAEQEKNMYLDRLTLIGFIGADVEPKPPTPDRNSQHSQWQPNGRGRMLTAAGNPGPNGTAVSPSANSVNSPPL